MTSLDQSIPQTKAVAGLVEMIGERIADEVEKVAGGRQSNCEQAARDVVAMVQAALTSSRGHGNEARRSTPWAAGRRGSQGRDRYRRHPRRRHAEGYGFALLIFGTGKSDGRMNYISNSNREDMLAALHELLARFEGRYDDKEAVPDGLFLELEALIDKAVNAGVPQDEILSDLRAKAESLAQELDL